VTENERPIFGIERFVRGDDIKGLTTANSVGGFTNHAPYLWSERAENTIQRLWHREIQPALNGKD